MKRILILVFVVVVAAGILYYLSIRNKEEGDSFIKVSGNIEATEADVGFKISGRIVSRFFEEGDWVEKGKVLARLDDQDLRQRLDLARATLMSAQARLSKLLAGSRPEELRQAEANLQQAQFDLENKEIQYERMKELYEKGVISKDTFDSAETRYKVAQAALQIATESYQLVKEGPRKEDIEDVRSQVAQAQSLLDVGRNTAELYRSQLSHLWDRFGQIKRNR